MWAGSHWYNFSIFFYQIHKSCRVFGNFQKFQLVCILSFQKRYSCPKKILKTKKLFKKAWSQAPFFSANFESSIRKYSRIRSERHFSWNFSLRKSPNPPIPDLLNPPKSPSKKLYDLSEMRHSTSIFFLKLDIIYGRSLKYNFMKTHDAVLWNIIRFLFPSLQLTKFLKLECNF